MKLIQFSSKREIKYLKENYAVDVVQRKTENACLEHFGERRTDNIKTSRTTVQRRYKSRFKRGMLQKLERLQIWSALYTKNKKSYRYPPITLHDQVSVIQFEWDAEYTLSHLQNLTVLRQIYNNVNGAHAWQVF